MHPEEAEELLHVITATISEVVWMATLDLSRILYVSPSFERVFGRSVESALADPASFVTSIHPDDRQRVADDYAAKRDGRPFEHEYRIVRPDGAVRWLQDRGYPVRNADGSIPYYVGVAQDITARKTAQLELDVLAERLRLLSRATKDGFWDWNMVTGDAWWNESIYEAFGLARSVSPGYQAWVDRVHPDDRDRVVGHFEHTIHTGGSGWVDEYRLLRPDGTVRAVYDRAYVVRDAAGTPVRMIGTMMDITERRSLEAQLRHAQKMEAVGQLAGGVAHDFNNILQAILLETDMIRATAGLPPDAVRRIDHVRADADRAARLTRQLLVFSRRDQVHARPVELNDTIVELARMLRRIVREDIALQLDLGPHALWVHADSGLLEQVLVNLAVNARDAMPRGGTLAISTTRVEHPGRVGHPAGAYVRIVVRDTGAGIAPDVLPRIFEPFFTTKPAGDGSGLGLAIAFGIVEQHRGWIEVDSAPGQGTAFAIFLPICAAAAAAAADQRALAPTAGTETILVVEDDAALRRLVRQVFEREGYRVVEAAYASAALAAWEREQGKVDLVLTDLVMPGQQDGWELVAELEARRPGLKVVIATGYYRDLAERGLAAHHTVLHKPVTAERLLQAVRTSLDAG
jgi:PAS domain S-box-containing protein